MQENRNDIDRKGKFVTLPGLREAVIEYLVECGGYKQEDLENALPVYFGDRVSELSFYQNAAGIYE